MVADEQIRVVDNPNALRYELSVDGSPAGFIAYRREPGAVVLVLRRHPEEANLVMRDPRPGD